MSTPLPVQQAQQLFSSEPPQQLQQPPQRMPSAARRQLRLADKGVLPPATSPVPAPSAAAMPPQVGRPEEAAAAVVSVHASAPTAVGQTAALFRSRSANAQMSRALNANAGNSLLFQAQLAKPAAPGQHTDEQLAAFSAADTAADTATSTTEISDERPAESGNAVAAAPPELSAGAQAAPCSSAPTIHA